MLDLADAEYIRRDGYPLLRVLVDGREALIEPARKPALFDLGLVFLGPDFEDRLPPIEYESPEGSRTTLSGFSLDRRLFLLQARLSAASADGTFRPGPVPIPEEDGSAGPVEHAREGGGMIGSVSATVGGRPALFVLGEDLIWRVERSEGVRDADLVRPLARLMYVAETTRPTGPNPVVRAAEAIGGTAYLAPGAWEEDETARAPGRIRVLEPGES